MKLKKQFNHLRIGKGLLCLLALFMMLLAPQGAWASVFTTSTLAEATEGDAKYTWAVPNLDVFDVYGDVTLSTDPAGLIVGSEGCTIRGLEGDSSAPSDYEHFLYKVKIAGTGFEDNSGITVKIINGSDNVYFIASTTAGEFYMPSSIRWDNGSELSIAVNKECTITSIEINRSTKSLNASYGWSSNPIDNGTIQDAKQDDGSIRISALEHQGYSYPLTNEGATYSSTNMSVATVGTDGTVTIKQAGSTTITATVHNYIEAVVDEDITFGYTLTVDFPAPTIIPNGGQQLEATEIALSYEATTMPDLKYKWGNGEETSYSEPFAVQTGTLTAWAEVVPSGSQTAIKSREATATFKAVAGTSYGLTVAGIPVTSDNYGNVLGDNEDVHKVTYNAESKTLTLNNATMSGQIVRTSTDNLIVNFIGTSTVILDNDHNGNVFVGNGGVLSFSTTGSVTNALVVNNCLNQSIISGWGGGSVSVDWGDDGDSMWWLGETKTSYQVTLYKKPTSYDLSIGGVSVTSANASDVLGNGNVSYNATTNTLTLNGATINLLIEGPGIRYTGTENFTIKLIGTNSITTQSGSEPIIFDPEVAPTTSPTLTFESGSQPCSLSLRGVNSSVVKYFGSVQGVNGLGSTTTGNLYLISDTEAQYIANTGLYKGETTSSGAVTSATITSGYGLTVADILVHDGNKNNILGTTPSSVSFTPAVAAEGDNPATPATLTLDGATIVGDIKTSLDNLTISVLNANTLTGTIKYTGESETATLTIDTNLEYANSASLALSTTSQEVGVISGYQSDNVTINSPLETTISAWTTDVKNATIAAERYDIIVAGVLVTNANKANVLETLEGTPTVSFTPASGETPAILALNGATIGGGSEPAEAVGVRYTGTADLTISLKGTNTITGTGGCEAIRFDGESAPKLIFAKGDDNECSLQLNAEEGENAIAGFSAIEGVWGIGDKDNGLAIIADSQVKYSQADGLQKETVVNYISEYVALSSTQIVSYYGLAVAGVPVYVGNKDNIQGKEISGSGSASYIPTTNTLTLNNVNLNPDYGQNEDVSVSIVTSLSQLNIDLIGESQTYAIKATKDNCALTFKSAEANRGAARLNFWDEAEPYFIGFAENKVTYEDGLCLREDLANTSFPNIVALDVPMVVTEEKERGLYYPDHEFVFSLDKETDGFDIYYANMLGGDPVKTTDGTFTLGAGRYMLRVYPIYSGMDTDPSKNAQFASEISAKVYAKPTFTLASGTYDSSRLVKLENIPDLNEEYPQIWYYRDDNKNDSIRYESDTEGIDVSESCKLSVYILDEDSGKVIKSDTVAAQYVIRKHVDLYFMANGKEVEDTTYVIGGKENQELPELDNENEVAVTYSSSNTNVATVNAETGEVTIVGMGETTITATSEETDYLLAGEASYTLTVYKDLSHESISVTVADATYIGEAVEPEVTIMDGETDITELLNIVYSNNVNAGSNAIVTITPNYELDDPNYYYGSATANFSIDYRTLADGEVTFHNNWATFYNAVGDVNLPPNIGAYIVTEVNNDRVIVTQIKNIPQGVAVLLNNETSTTPENTTVTGNKLLHADKAIDTSTGDAVYYGLYNGMMKRIYGTIPEGKNYLMLSIAIAPQNAPQLNIVIGNDGNTTGISQTESRESEVENVYDLQGRKIQKPSKNGMYIKNGRKVLINNNNRY